MEVSAFVLLEFVHARPGEGVCSVFTFGKSTGTALGAIHCCHTPEPVEVAPLKWQNFYKRTLKIPKSTPFKSVTRDVAEALFPTQAHLFARKKDHGTADAALIAAYGALHFKALAALRPAFDRVIGRDPSGFLRYAA